MGSAPPRHRSPAWLAKMSACRQSPSLFYIYSKNVSRETLFAPEAHLPMQNREKISPKISSYVYRAGQSLQRKHRHAQILREQFRGRFRIWPIPAPERSAAASKALRWRSRAIRPACPPPTAARAKASILWMSTSIFLPVSALIQSPSSRPGFSPGSKRSLFVKMCQTSPP